jgi:uncharacterized membrane protein (GlpM family)
MCERYLRILTPKYFKYEYIFLSIVGKGSLCVADRYPDIISSMFFFFLVLAYFNFLLNIFILKNTIQLIAGIIQKILAWIKSCLFHIRNMYSSGNVHAQRIVANIIIVSN